MFRLIAEERNEIRRSDEALQTCFQAIDRNHDPKTQKHILGSQFTVIGTSDGGGRPHTADRHETSTNLLGHWVRDQQVMTLEEAVYRLTGKTALMHDITDRGFIAAGKVADITIYYSIDLMSAEKVGKP
jgi:N-acyl-D-aspartate/D-glutamate deacylase